MARNFILSESQVHYIINNEKIAKAKEYLEKEEHIQEERGVGVAPYIESIKSICNYASSYVKENKKYGQDLNFEIPLSYTKSLQMFSELHIKCIISDDANKKFGGNASISSFPNISKKYGKFLTPQEICISAFANGNILDRRSFIGTLYHELNHKIDELKHLSNDKERKSDVYLQGEVLQSLRKTDFPDEICKTLMVEIVYRLFSSTEFNALVSSVFGDLSAIKSERKSYRDDIKTTDAYKVYSFIKKHLDLLNDIPIENYKRLQKLLKNTILYPKGRGSFSETELFKKKFISITLQRLEKLLHMIGKTASYYYDVSEYDNEANNRKIETINIENFGN